MGPGGWLLIVLGVISAISWIAGKLNEQREAREAKERLEAARREQARTGGREDPFAAVRNDGDERETVPSRASRSPSDLAARRQAQIEELRRRAAERREGVSAQAGTAPPPARRPQTIPRRPQRQAEEGLGPELIEEQERSRLREQMRRQQLQARRAAELRRQAESPAEQPRSVRPPSVRRRDVDEFAEVSSKARRRARAQESREEARQSEQQDASAAPVVLDQHVNPSARMIRRLLTEHAGRTSQRRRLAQIIALSEVLQPPVSARRPGEMSWERSL